MALSHRDTTGASNAKKAAGKRRATPGWPLGGSNGWTQRADSLHARKSDATARARELAENKGAELVIKDERGRVTAKDSHGNDPRRIKG